MPLVDGITATREIRAWEHQCKDVDTGESKTPPVQIVAMTADVVGDARERHLSAGMNHFLTKPIQLDKVRVSI